MKFTIASALIAAASVAEFFNAQTAQAWAQCGGQGFTGLTTCDEGYTCKVQNDYYSQCVPSNDEPEPTTESSTLSSDSTDSFSTESSPAVKAGGGSKSAGCGNTAYKLVFALHWRGGSMRDAAAIEGGYYGLQALAKESTIFVALNGLNQGWANSGGEDVLLVDAILNKIQSSLCVETTKVFSTGFSYGAGMSYALACARPDKFRAVALYAGAQLSGCAGGSKPIAFWSTHGVHDSVLPIASGRALRDHFLQVNGCQSKTAPEPSNVNPHQDCLHVQSWLPCSILSPHR
ncbi:hypothetical protein LEN26_019130 [Aphanomyces euteiches]|nr:hypothetical protein LEN26_019130 [Aphanomyces euteiches]KAH9103738.1 hypothetical protein AeMF1_019992 [Aphanomyces euteiches]KAH9182719.1 hypothetical protein AeNC1_015305 [Aphanomyces euteiches]